MIVGSEPTGRPRTRNGSRAVSVGVILALAVATGAPSIVAADPTIVFPEPLSTVEVPEPDDLDVYIADRDAAIRLGKAFFWDMQVGGDGVTACASCHFHAGSDSRATGQLRHGLQGVEDTTFEVGSPNHTLAAIDFPFRVLEVTHEPDSRVLRDLRGVVSSQGVIGSEFLGLSGTSARDWGRLREDHSPFEVDGVPMRQVEPRATPTVINAVFNVDNFWDGRASRFFNGRNPFGVLDLNAFVWKVEGDELMPERVLIDKSSLASQALAPIVDNVEMTGEGRSRIMLGRKMLRSRPLARQLVHPHDSVLGELSRARLDARGELARGARGLETTYAEMIEAAIQPEWWAGEEIVRIDEDGTEHAVPHPGRPLTDNEFSHMEANFALIFGLALQVYQSELISDQTPFDAFLAGDESALTATQRIGAELFFGRTQCHACHDGPELTNAAFTMLDVDGPIELMEMGDDAGGAAFYDTGFYNVGLRPPGEDLSRARTAPFVNPLTGERFPISRVALAMLKRDGLLPEEVAERTPDLPLGLGSPDPDRASLVGASKTPGMRNLELTGPFFKTGSAGTIRQSVDFYLRGGDFRAENAEFIHPEVFNIPGIDEPRSQAMVEFFLALTDERVRNESAPFDHPEIFVPEGRFVGEDGRIDINRPHNVKGAWGFEFGERVTHVPAVGAQGRSAAGLPPLGGFLDLDPHDLGEEATRSLLGGSAAIAPFSTAEGTNPVPTESVSQGQIRPAQVAPPPPDQWEPDDTPVLSRILPPVSTHTFHRIGDEDWSRITATRAGETFALETIPLAGDLIDTVIEVRRLLPDGSTELLAANDSSPMWRDTTGSTLLFTAPDTETFFVRVRQSDPGEMGVYELRWTRGPLLRVSGANRFATAAAASRLAHSATHLPVLGSGIGPNSVVVASGEGFADALAGGVLASLLDTSLLLVRSAAAPGVTLAEIERLSASRRAAGEDFTVYLLGGDVAVSAATELQIAALNAVTEVVRLAGRTRVETAIEIARQQGKSAVIGNTAVIVRSDIFPDALAAGPVAARMLAPILLTHSGSVPRATLDALEEFDIENVVIAGGPNAVSAEAQAQIEAAVSGDVVRVEGRDRYETARALAQFGVDELAMRNNIVLASGVDFPDALVSTPLARWTGGPVLTTPPNVLAPAVREFIDANPRPGVPGYVIGGPRAIAESVVERMRE